MFVHALRVGAAPAMRAIGDLVLNLEAYWTAAIRGTAHEITRPEYRFDPVYYRATNPDVDDAGVDPAAHFDAFGRTEGRVANRYGRYAESIPGLAGVIRTLVRDPLLRAALDDTPDAPELAFELIALGEPFDRAVSDFSAAHYVKTYQDVSVAQIDPFVHYVCFGMREGRHSLGDLRKNERAGAQSFDPARPTVLICTHDLSRTGAPIVAATIARSASTTHNVVVASCRDGPMLDTFLESAVTLIVSAHPFDDLPHLESAATAAISFAIVNSVESFGFAKYLVSRDVPFAAYIHEYAEYTWPAYKKVIMALYADVLVFSSYPVQTSWADTLGDVAFDVARDAAIVPQESLMPGTVDRSDYDVARREISELIGVDTAGRRVVYGAGFAQWRKGTDLFLMVAQQARAVDPSALFVWIGDGISLEDLEFGVWLGKHMAEAGANVAGGNLFFLPAGPYYLSVCQAADILFLSSRLDPLPNVVFDAVRHGCQVVLFQHASGFDDPCYRDQPMLRRVAYGDLAAAVTALIVAPRKFSTPRGLDALRSVLGRRPAPPPPIASARPDLFGTIAALVRDRVAAQPTADGAGSYDVSILYDGTPTDAGNRRRDRAKLWRTGRRAIWRDRTEVEATLRDADDAVTRTIDIEDYSDEAPAGLPPYRIHLHAHYIDGIEADFAGHAAYREAAAIVVTTDTAQKARQVEAVAAAASLAVEVRVVPNRGRDILPFLELFDPAASVEHEDVWCHVHRKRSTGTAKDGDRWRQFLTRILLGDATSVSCGVRTATRANVGLVCALDPHVMGWTASRRLLRQVAPSINLQLPEHPLLFPIGNMFWVKAEVVLTMKRLFGPHCPWPNEPIASDGTPFHLIERLWPTAAALASRRSVFINKPDERRT